MTAEITKYDLFLSHCQNLNILNAYEFKPLIDGTALAKALETRPGPWMKEALDVVMAWQLRNPDNDDITAVVSEVQSWKQQVDVGKRGNHAEKKQYQRPGPKDGVISKKQKQGELTSALISHFLHLTLRPIFSQKQHPDLTATGRRNINATISRKSQTVDLDGDKPAWRGNQSWALDLLFWICRNIDPITVEREWGVLIPPVLTVLDSTDVETKAIGCKLLQLVLDQTPNALLSRTGLAPVFEESLYTCTAYLPSFTPPADSANILSAALPALLSLADAVHPVPSPARTKFLLSILRKGFLAPMNHASEHVVISKVLYNNLPSILKALGIDCVVHLKDLVPMISATLNDPLGPAYPPLLLATARALHELVIEARPRAWFWRVDILKGVCGLWIRLHPLSGQNNDQGAKSQLQEINEGCKEVVEALDDAIRDKDWAEEDIRDGWPDEVNGLIEADERLKLLFNDISVTK
jgi:tRNA nucleotidyltransferase (CCA-adding enzyme)